MMARLAQTYVAVLFVIQLLLLGASLLLHMFLWSGASNLPTEIVGKLLVGSFLLAFVSAALAKERNVWRNEFKWCPMWVRVLSASLGVYGTVFALCQTVLFPGVGGTKGDLLTLSAMSLSIDAVFLCIPYALLWTNSVPSDDVVRRSRTSLIAAVIVTILFIAEQSGYLSHPMRREGP